jgi:hypothetical protein
MYNLFLDDIRMPYVVGDYIIPVSYRSFYRLKEWVIVRSYKEFVDYILLNGLPELVSFDHDLADAHYDPQTWTESFQYTEETGYDCAKWLVKYCMDNKLKLPEYLVHSMNPVGAVNIQKYLDNFKKSENQQKIQ